MPVGENLKKAMEDSGVNSVRLAELSGVGDGRISEIVNGKTLNPRFKTLEKLASALGIGVEQLISGQESALSVGITIPQGYRQVKIYNMAGAGAPCTIAEYEPIDSAIIPDRWMKNGIVAVKIRGRSMEPTIMNGSIIGVDLHDKKIVSGEPFGFWLPYEGAVVRRVFMNFDSITLKPDNPSFESRTIKVSDISDTEFILGRVKWVLQEL